MIECKQIGTAENVVFSISKDERIASNATHREKKAEAKDSMKSAQFLQKVCDFFWNSKWSVKNLSTLQK